MSAGRISNSNIPAGMNAPVPPSAGADAGKAADAAGVAVTRNPGQALPQGAPDAGGDSKDYGVNISDSAKHRAEAHHKALNIARNTPDVREDRVAALKKQIDEGSYHPDSGKIADGMLREAIRDHLAENEG